MNLLSNSIPLLLIQVLLSHASQAGPVGFGGKSTGGSGGKEVVVTSASELLEAASSKEPLMITVKGAIIHDVSGADDDGRIRVRSNKTIQGADHKASVDGNFHLKEADNVIFRNLTLSNPEGKGTGDALEFSSCTNIWVDHCTFLQCEDGALDIKRESDLITVSWCKFAYPSATHKHNFAHLIGHSDSYTRDRGKLRVTMHHNWYADNVIERMPRVRYGQVHIFNNYYASDRVNYVIGVGVESQILLEASYFQDQGTQTWKNLSKENAVGRIQWTSDNVFAGNTAASTWVANSKVFKPTYPYKLDKAKDVPALVQAGAGVQPAKKLPRLPAQE